LGDFVVAGNGWNFNEAVFGSNFSDGVVGVGGLLSGLIVCYNVVQSL
jgi:hypothetical protein